MRKISKALRQFVSEAKQGDSYWVELTKLQFALSLEERRKAANMTYKALAEKLDASAAYISKVFRGESNMTIESMVKLARATGGNLVVRIADCETEMDHWSGSAFVQTRPQVLKATEASLLVVPAMNDELSLAA